MFNGKMRKGRGPTPFRPMREWEDMRRVIDEDVVRPVMHAVWDRIPEEMKAWSPSMDVFEKGENLMVKVELPGMKQEDIDLYVTDETLTIKGNRDPEAGIKEEDYYRNEIGYGSIYRMIDLPFAVDTKSIEALYEDGILRITLQRVAGSKPKRVTVQVKKGAA
jgi:HSP20 family protein